MKRLWIAVALLAAMCGATLVNAYYCQQLADSLSCLLYTSRCV